MHEKPQIGSQVTVKTKYFSPSIWGDWHEYELTGDVISVPWLAPNQFAVTNPNHPNKFSVISLDKVVDLRSNKATIKLDSDYKEWTVQGSKGNTYLVIRKENKYTCSCPGFTFRKNCRHLAEVR